MYRTGILAAVSLTVMAGPAFAQEGGFYAGADLGLVFAETDQQYIPGNTAGTTGNISTDHKLGFGGSAVAGYDFGAFRVEAEAGYTSADIDGLTTNFTLPGGAPPGSQSSDGDVSAQTLMANVTADVGAFNDFTFFIGGGAGVAKLKISMLGSSGSTVLDDEDDWRSAWQAIVGVRKPLSGNIDMHVRYRYFNVADAEFTGFGGRAVTAELTTHSVEAGVTFNF